MVYSLQLQSLLDRYFIFSAYYFRASRQTPIAQLFFYFNLQTLVKINRKFLQLINAHYIQRSLVCACEIDLGRHILLIGLQPARGAQTPAITGVETRKAEVWHWRREIVPPKSRVL